MSNYENVFAGRNTQGAADRVEKLFSRKVGADPVFYPAQTNSRAYNFDQGVAAGETFPTEHLLRLARKVLDRDGGRALEYMSAKGALEDVLYGFRPLREQLVRRMKAVQNVDLSPEGVILTSGSVQAISLAIAAFLDPDDIVAVEAVSFPYALKFIQSAGADIRPLPISHQGMDVDALANLVDDLARQNKRLKLVYLGPTFHCPTGAEMPLDARVKLVKLAQKHGFLVLEDDVYSDLRFAGDKLPSLLSLDDSGLVMQAGTFSKTVVPGIRLGWMMGAPRVIAGLAAVRQDLGVSLWMSYIMEEFLKEGLLEPHLVEANKVYEVKSQAAMSGLEALRGDLVKFETPRGSFYLWVEIDQQVDWAKVKAEADEAGIFFRPGERFLSSADPRQFFRMAYSQEPVDVVMEGSAKLGQIIRKNYVRQNSVR